MNSHKTIKTCKTFCRVWESGQQARFPAATQLGAATNYHAVLYCFVGFVINNTI